MSTELPRHLLTQDLGQRLNLALQAHRRGELDAARALYRSVLEQHARSFDALHSLGVLCLETGAVGEAIDLIRRALTIEPDSAAALCNLAGALSRTGQDREALDCLDRSLVLKPDSADAWYLRGNVLQRSQTLEESIACYLQALRFKPVFPEAFNNLATAQRGLRLLGEAYASVQQALALRPAYPRAINNRGLIALDRKRGAEAIEDFRRALALNPSFLEALHNLGTALMQLRRFAEASEAFSQLTRLAPAFPHGAGNRLYAKLNDCDWTDFEPLRLAVVRSVERGEPAAVPMAFLCMSGSAALQLRCAEAYARTYYPAGAPHPAHPAHPDRPGRAVRRRDGKIRLAYLSGDLGDHAVTYLMAGVFERHDTDRFETVALAWDRQADPFARGRAEQAFTHFIDVSAKSDGEVARLMHELEVDIAVDLAGHTLGQRTAILAQRPAPVQVSYLGLPATMGAPYIDYLIADRFLIPEEQRPMYSEKVVWLEGGFQPNDDRRPSAADSKPRHALGLPDEGLVFCSFNRNCKLNPPCFAVWMRLLAAVPGSVLWLLASHRGAAENLRLEAAARGVAPDRLIFAEEAPYPEYLSRYRHVDLFLDTTPFNGGATVSDALSMGAPVLTMAGESFAARMAGSLLMSLGLPELVTPSLEAYESAALRLARDPMRLRRLREQLERHRESHAFFDTDRYRANLEAAFQAMWERHRAGLPPAHFALPGRSAGARQAATAETDNRMSGPMNGA